MSAFVSQHVTALRGALRRFFTAPLNTLLSLLVIGIALALPCAGWVAIDNLLRVAGNTSGTQEISIFMDVSAGKKDVAGIESRLREASPGEWRLVTREDALEQLRAAEGMGEIIASLPKNPLPDAFVLAPRREDPALFERMAERGAGSGLIHFLGFQPQPQRLGEPGRDAAGPHRDQHGPFASVDALQDVQVFARRCCVSLYLLHAPVE